MPETFWDSLVTHLALPNYYVLEGKVQTTPFHIHSYFTQNSEMLAMQALLLKSEVGAGLVHWGFFLTLLALTLGWLSRVSTFSIALIAIFVFLATPISTWAANHIKNDLPMALFLVFHWWSLMMAIEKRETDEEDSQRWMFLSGIFGGGAVGHKLVALPTLLVSFLSLVFWHRRSLLAKKISKGLWAWLLGVALTVGPWFVRNLIVSGNPVYPYLNSVLKRPFLSEWHQPIPQQNSIQSMGVDGIKMYFGRLCWLVEDASRDTVWGTTLFMGLFSFLFLSRKFGQAKQKVFLVVLASWLLSLVFSLETRYHTAHLFMLFCCFFAMALHEIQGSWIKAMVIFVTFISLLKTIVQSKIMLLIISAYQVLFSALPLGHFRVESGSQTLELARLSDIRCVNHLIDRFSDVDDKILFVGITRTYGATRRFYGSSDLDIQVLHFVSSNSENEKGIYVALKNMGVRSILLDRAEWNKYMDSRKFSMAENEISKIEKFFQAYTVLQYGSMDDKLHWYKLVDGDSKKQPEFVLDDFKDYPYSGIDFSIGIMNKGETARAQGLLEKIVSWKTIPMVRSEALGVLTELASRSNDLPELLRYSREAIAVDPHNSSPFLRMAVSEMYASRDRKKSIQWVNKAIQNDPDATAAHPIFHQLRTALRF